MQFLQTRPAAAAPECGPVGGQAGAMGPDAPSHPPPYPGLELLLLAPPCCLMNPLCPLPQWAFTQRGVLGIAGQRGRGGGQKDHQQARLGRGLQDPGWTLLAPGVASWATGLLGDWGPQNPGVLVFMLPLFVDGDKSPAGPPSQACGVRTVVIAYPHPVFPGEVTQQGPSCMNCPGSRRQTRFRVGDVGCPLLPLTLTLTSSHP